MVPVYERDGYVSAANFNRNSRQLKEQLSIT